jgi:hypothetical protein
VLGVAGCGRVDEVSHAPDVGVDGAADAGIDLAAVCRSYWLAFCSAYHECMPSLFEYGMGNEAHCVEALNANCVSFGSRPGVRDWAGHMRCAEAATHDPQYRCTGFLSDILEGGSCDDLRGTLPVGSACEGSGQCASGECGHRSPTCGQCVPEPSKAALGESCGGDVVCVADAGCERTGDGGVACLPIAEEGEACAGKACRHIYQQCKGTCVTLSRFGEPCETYRDCLGDGFCDDVTHRCTWPSNAGLVRASPPGSSGMHACHRAPDRAAISDCSVRMQASVRHGPTASSTRRPRAARSPPVTARALPSWLGLGCAHRARRFVSNQARSPVRVRVSSDGERARLVRFLPIHRRPARRPSERTRPSRTDRGQWIARGTSLARGAHVSPTKLASARAVTGVAMPERRIEPRASNAAGRSS